MAEKRRYKTAGFIRGGGGGCSGPTGFGVQPSSCFLLVVGLPSPASPCHAMSCHSLQSLFLTQLIIHLEERGGAATQGTGARASVGHAHAPTPSCSGGRPPRARLGCPTSCGRRIQCDYMLPILILPQILVDLIRVFLIIWSVPVSIPS